MPPDEEKEAPHAFERLSREQLEIYAKEIQEQFRDGVRLRKEMEAQNQQMMQQLREITALNQLFQQHLSERFEVVDAYRHVLNDLKKLAQETAALARRAESQPLPDIQDFQSTSTQNGDVSRGR